MRTATVFGICVGLLCAARADEPAHEAALRACARALDAAFKSGDKAAIRKAMMASFATEADVKAIFPRVHAQIWPHVRQLNEKTLGRIETASPEEFAKMRDEGRLLAVTLTDIRKKEAGRRAPKEYVAAVPDSIPIYSYETKSENGESGTYPFFWVGGRWVSLKHIPERLAEFAGSEAAPAAQAAPQEE